MRKLLRSLLLAVAIGIAPVAAAAQQSPFTPITIDAVKLQQISALIAKQSMPADAHVALQNMLQDLERQAQIDASVAAAAKKAAAEPPKQSMAEKYKDMAKPNGAPQAPKTEPEQSPPSAD